MAKKSNFFSTKIFAGDIADNARSYDLLSNDQQKRGYIHHFIQHKRAIGEFLQKFMNQLFNGTDCTVVLSDFSMGCPNQQTNTAQFLWLTSQLPEQDDAIYMAIEPASLHEFSVLFLGGKLSDKPRTTSFTVLTETEKRLGFQLFQQMISACKAAQKSQQPGGISVQNGQAIPPYYDIVSADNLPMRGQWVTLSLSVTIDQHPFSWRFWWPFEDELPETLTPNQSAPDMTALLSHIPVRLRVQLANAHLPIETIAALSVGDIVPLELNEPTPAYIGHDVCFEGRVAEQRGSLVFQVTAVKP